MSVDTFIPQLWASTLLERLHAELVYAQDGIVNTDYQGQINQKGDSVNINQIGAVTVTDYTKNTDHAAPETLATTETTLTIDQAKLFNFEIDDVDRAQVADDGNLMAEAMRESAYALASVADTYLAGKIVAGVDPGNLIGSDTTPEVVTPSSSKLAYDELVDLSTILDEANCPNVGRWVIVPPWFHGLLRKDDRFVHATAYGDQVLQNGEIGQAAGFRVLKSNNVPNTTGTKYKIVAGSSTAVSFAEQINEVRAFRPERRMADAVKGLHLYGSAVIRPTCVALLTANSA